MIPTLLLTKPNEQAKKKTKQKQQPENKKRSSSQHSANIFNKKNFFRM